MIKHLGPWFSLRRERRRLEWRTLWQLSEELTATLHFWETEFLCLSIFCTLNLLCKYSFVHLALLFDKPIKNSFCQKSKEGDKYLSYKTRTFQLKRVNIRPNLQSSSEAGLPPEFTVPTSLSESTYPHTSQCTWHPACPSSSGPCFLYVLQRPVSLLNNVMFH